MSKKLSLLLAIVMIASMLLTACQPAAETSTPEQPGQPAEATQPAAESKGKVCQVTDTGGIDDKSFNATAWAGAERAQSELGMEAKYLESQQQTDYEKNINAFIEEGCSVIVTVGFLLGDATKAAAEANPEQKFAIVDFAYDPAIENVLGLTFATDQAGFLAGYLAAGTTKTGKVGTFGGLNIPTVTIFMDGFYYGVQYYNEQNGTDVQVLGWDPAAPDQGLFTGNFESTDDGRTMGQTLLGEGADVIMPVAGPVGLGTAEAVKAAGNAWIVGVDTDWTVSAEAYKDIVLTSVAKKMDVAVFEAAKAASDDSFKGGIYTGTLENDGVGLATIAASVPADMKTKLDEIQAGIIDGSIKVKP